MRIKREDAAALIIDFQEKLVPAIAGHEELMKRVRTLLGGLRLLEVPMVVTQQNTKGLGMSVPEIWEASGVNGYQDKMDFSGLEAAEPFIRGRRYILVCGMEAHCCVLQTVIDLAAAGYVPVLVTDCIGSRKAVDLKIAVERARQEGAVLTTYEAVLFELLKSAESPVCKKILKLIK